MSGRMPAVSHGRARERRTDRGAVAVEFALVLPLVIVLLLGTVTAGVAYSHGIGLTNAVREGARFGAVTVKGGSWGSAVVGRTKQTQFDDPTATTTICAWLLQNTSGVDAQPSFQVATGSIVTPSASCPAVTSLSLPSVPDKKCLSVVWASRPYKIQTGLFGTYPGNMKPKSAALYERTC